MTVRSTMKSYCKVIQVTYETSASVDFKDTAGTAVECNYFSVDCRSASTNDNGFFIAQPSGVYGTEIDGISTGGLVGANSVSSVGSHTGNGMGGVIGTADGSVEMSLNSNQKTSGIMLFNKLVGTTAATLEGGEAAVFVVTYGNMKQANPKRDQDDAFYPPGT